MTQRRTPGGQGPPRRSRPSGGPWTTGGNRATGGTTRATGGTTRATGGGPRAGGTGRAGTGSRVTGGPRAAGGARGGGEAARSAARPPAARRPAATGSAKRTNAPRPRRLTGRAAVLGALLLALLLAYSYPIRAYLSQQAEIARLEQEHAVQRAHIDDLAVERANWNDEEFVKTQARKRFQLVERGDKTYVVFFDSAGAGQAPGGAADQAGGRAEPSWYARLWSSIDAANKPSER